MKKIAGNIAPIYLKAFLAALLIGLAYPNGASAQENVLQQNITLQRQHSSLYTILNQISRQTGYFFVYDSQIIDSNKKIRIARTHTDMLSFLNEVLDDPSLSFRIIERHILIYRPQENHSIQADIPLKKDQSSSPDYIIVQGRVLDAETGSPLAFASVGLPSRGLGIPANTEGYFRFKVSRELENDSLRISFMGYKTQYIPILLLEGQNPDIRLITDYISMQEVIIRYFDPYDIIQQAISRRAQNYSTKPTYLITFYREGVQQNQKFLNYSEAVFRLYKSSYTDTQTDQAIVLKSRNLTNRDHTDTLMLKLKAGVKSALELDIMKNIPDFLDPDFFNYYTYQGADLVSINSGSAYAIDFQQKDFVTEPLFMGTLFIDQQSMALVRADFRVNPKYLDNAVDKYVLKKSRNKITTLQDITYSVSYQEHDGIYYLNHVRGDIHLRIRNRGKLFSQGYHVFLELAVNDIETENVNRFRRREALQTNTIFAEQEYEYDYEFWGEYNTIAPEKHIQEALQQIRPRIENLITGN